MKFIKCSVGPECTETAGLCRHCVYVTTCFTVTRSKDAAVDIAPAFEKRCLRERGYGDCHVQIVSKVLIIANAPLRKINFEEASPFSIVDDSR